MRGLPTIPAKPPPPPPPASAQPPRTQHQGYVPHAAPPPAPTLGQPWEVAYTPVTEVGPDSVPPTMAVEFDDPAGATQELSQDELEELMPPRNRMWVALLLGGIAVILLFLILGGFLLGPWSPLHETSTGGGYASGSNPAAPGDTPAGPGVMATNQDAPTDEGPKPPDEVAAAGEPGAGSGEGPESSVGPGGASPWGQAASPPVEGDGTDVAATASETPAGTGADENGTDAPPQDPAPVDRSASNERVERPRDETPRERRQPAGDPDRAPALPASNDQASTGNGESNGADRPASDGANRRSSAREGRLFVLTAPYARVYLDGRLLGTTPIMNREVPAGRHTLYLVNPSFPAKRMQVTVRPGQVVRVGHNFQTGI